MTILLVETIPLLKEALARQFQCAGHSVIEHSSCDIDCLYSFLEQHRTDLLWLDTTVIGLRRMSILKTIRKAVPDTKVLLFGIDETLPEIKNYFLQGIHGYIPKTSAIEEINSALSKVATDGVYITSSLHQKFDAWITQPVCRKKTASKLSQREKEILELIVEENTTNEIAKKLFLSHCTVETHRINLIHKLGVKNTAGLVRIAFETGLYVS